MPVQKTRAEKRIAYAVDYIFKFYNTNTDFTPLAEPEIEELVGDINLYQWIAYKGERYRIHFYFSYILNKKHSIAIDLLDEDYSFVQKIK